MSLTKVSLGGNRKNISARETLGSDIPSRLGTGIRKSFFYGVDGNIQFSGEGALAQYVYSTCRPGELLTFKEDGHPVNRR
jgi:hypothetical protein